MSQQLQQIEELSVALLTRGDQAAQKQLADLGSNVTNVPTLQLVFEHSENPYALLVAAKSLTRLATEHWTSFTVEQRVEIRNYVLNFLATKGPAVQEFVVTEMIQLACRITKLGWFDGSPTPVMQDIVDEAKKFLTATVAHAVIGLQLLCQLIAEVNIRGDNRTVTQHRKVAVSFRDRALLPAFKLAISTMQQVLAGKISTPVASGEAGVLLQQKLLMVAVDTAIEGMSFDFIGTNPNDADDDFNTVQVPSGWRSVVGEPESLKLLADLYYNVTGGQVATLRAADGSVADTARYTSAEIAAKLLELFALVVSVRRSMFPSDAARKQFLLQAMFCITKIMEDKQGLGEEQCYHRFCRLLGRMKANYQLSELIRTDGYSNWLRLTVDFSLEAFRALHDNTVANSVDSLLTLWSRMVAAVPYVRVDASSSAPNPQLQTCAPSLVAAYVQARLALVPRIVQGEVDEDELSNPEAAAAQAEALAGMARYVYADTANTMRDLMDPLVDKYEELLGMVRSSGAAGTDATISTVLKVLEQQLAWCCYFCGAILAGQSFGSAGTMSGEEEYDAELARRALRVLHVVQRQLNATPARTSDDALEHALLYFMFALRRTFLSESNGMPAPAAASLGGSANTALMDDSAANTATDQEQSAMQASMRNSKARIFQNFFQKMQMGDHLVVTASFIKHVRSVLLGWPHNGDMLDAALRVLHELAYAYSAGRLLLSLEEVNLLILGNEGTGNRYAFMDMLEHGRRRTLYFQCIARLIFIAEDPEPVIVKFMSPLLEQAQLALKMISGGGSEVALVVAGLARDLRGIVSATHSRATWHAVWDVLSETPAWFELFRAALQVWVQEPAVTTPILKFAAELALNKSQRVVFPNSSPGGILLFRELAKIVAAYGKQAVNFTPAHGSHYTHKWKGVGVMLQICARALEGGYVNTGVLQLYNDPAFQDAMDTALACGLSVNQEELESLPKFAQMWFHWVRIMAHFHTPILVGLDSGRFRLAMVVLQAGLEHNDATVATHAAGAVDSLATYFVKHARKDVPGMQALRAQLSTWPTMWEELMTHLFNLLVWGNVNNAWSMSRPLLPLILASEAMRAGAWESFKQQLRAGTPEGSEHRANLDSALANLMGDVTRSLDSPNRDRFSQKLTHFRLQARLYIAV